MDLLCISLIFSVKKKNTSADVRKKRTCFKFVRGENGCLGLKESMFIKEKS